MANVIFPPGNTIFEGKAFRREFLEMTIEEIVKSKKFTGYIRIDKAGDSKLFLFFLKSVSYASGEINGSRPLNINIREFFDRCPQDKEEGAFISLHETDPVLMKGMLVYFQKESSIKAETNLINLEDILSQIQSGSSDAVIILRKGGLLNQFFFKDGDPVMAHFADKAFASSQNDVSLVEQFYLYAYQSDKTPVEAIVYRDISTSNAQDAEEINDEELMCLPYKKSAPPPAVSPTPPMPAPQAPSPIAVLPQPQTQQAPRTLPTRVTLIAEEGPLKGSVFKSAVPCLIGRKEASIVVADPLISRHHARLKLQNGRLVIEDLQSTNGTMVNGVEIKVKELCPGDKISLGDSVLRVESIG